MFSSWTAESTAAAATTTTATEAATAATGCQEQADTTTLGQGTIQQQVQGEILKRGEYTKLGMYCVVSQCHDFKI